MKVAAVVCSSLLIVAAMGTVAAVAQNPIPFQHVVLIIQENRTPDNLFGAGPPHPVCGVPDGFESGVDIDNGGMDQEKGLLCLRSTTLSTCWDVPHGNVQWNNQAHISIVNNQPVAAMDGACKNSPEVEAQGCPLPDCTQAQYTYVQKSDVQPYFDIATNYGFANYMFATNQGPSFPAHLFLLSGTSAPVAPGDLNSYYLDFVSANDDFGSSGCNGFGAPVGWVDYTDAPLMGTPGCYEHQTLVDQLDRHQPSSVSWRYYTPGPGVIWTAVNAIQHLCWAPGTNSGPCNSTDWQNVIWPGKTSTYQSNGVPALLDIQNCQLKQMNWLVPDGLWSDHNGFNAGAGPSYVASIVNAIGNSGCTDMVNGHTYTYWQDTAIFIVWDDWGGLYDHVSPFSILRQYPNNNNVIECQHPSQTWGCGFTYGFRVPLLVVSAYTKAGYVSGSIAPGGPGMQSDYIHDFGSILRFVEKNFGLNYIVSTPGYYADYNAPDNGERPGGDGNIPLSDFFKWPYRDFTPINPAVGMDANYFINYFANHPTAAPTGPDGEDND